MDPGLNAMAKDPDSVASGEEHAVPSLILTVLLLKLNRGEQILYTLISVLSTTNLNFQN